MLPYTTLDYNSFLNSLFLKGLCSSVISSGKGSLNSSTIQCIKYFQTLDVYRNGYDLSNPVYALRGIGTD